MPSSSQPTVSAASSQDGRAMSPSHKIQLHTEADANSPMPQVALRKLRFLTLVAIGVGVTSGGLACFLPGITITTGVHDAIGTTTNADSRVEVFQSISGFMWAAIGLLLEEYFKIFIAAMLIYFTNRPWHPRDEVTNGPNPLKRRALFWFTPLMMYIVNIGLSSVFVEHKLDSVVHRFVDGDLVNPLTSSAAALSSTHHPADSTTTTSVLDTALRPLVLNRVVPFQINDADSRCAISATNVESVEDGDTRDIFIPSLNELQSTSMYYAFPPRSWNGDAMPRSLEPVHTITLTQASSLEAETEHDFAAFMQASGVTYETLGELLVQGMTLHGKATTDSNMHSTYKCTDGPSSATCYGGGDYLEPIVDLSRPQNQNVVSLFASLYEFDGIEMDEVSVTLETYVLSPQINTTMLTLDLPFAINSSYTYDTGKVCKRDGTFKNATKMAKKYPDEDEYAEQQRRQCDRTVVSYDHADETCGERNCILEDFSDALNLNQQVQLIPYMTGCDPRNVTYVYGPNSWFPADCTPQNDAAFLYGLGSYFEGNLQVRGGKDGPVITNPRRHYVATFAKLNWRFEDVSKRFGASCSDAQNGCQGLLHVLENGQSTDRKARVLVVAADRTPDYSSPTMDIPLPLVVLRTPKFYEYAGENMYYTYEYMDLARMNTTAKIEDGLGFDKGACSLYIDAYLTQVETNHYYIQDPRQVMYTAAIFYLFQDGVVKEVTLPDGNREHVVDLSLPVIGSAHWKEDLELVEIRYSVPLPSVVSTCIGIVSLIVYMSVVLKWPRDARKLSDETTPAAIYVETRVDAYPPRIHTRRLGLADGTVVEMDEYHVQRLELRHVDAPNAPIVLE